MTRRLGLNLGSGERLLLSHEDIRFTNIDLCPDVRKKADELGADLLTLDLARHGLPFEDASVDFVNMAQFFEHLNLVDGLRLLAECQRVLRPLALLRVSVPDAALLIDHWRRDKLSTYIPTQPPVYNQVKSPMLRLGLLLFGSLHEHGETGHKQCYDEQGLAEVLEMTWFQDPHRVPFDGALDAPAARDHQLALVARKPIYSLS